MNKFLIPFLLLLSGCQYNLNVEILEEIKETNTCDFKYIPLSPNDGFDVTDAKYIAMYEKVINCRKSMNLTNDRIDNFKDIF